MECSCTWASAGNVEAAQPWSQHAAENWTACSELREGQALLLADLLVVVTWQPQIP